LNCIDAKRSWPSNENCYIKLIGGGTRSLFVISGATNPGTVITADGYRIDLSEFTGTLNLGNVASGHNLVFTRLTIINPNNRPVNNNIGTGQVSVSLGVRDQAKDFFTPWWN
jgi:hypothetical protein